MKLLCAEKRSSDWKLLACPVALLGWPLSLGGCLLLLYHLASADVRVVRAPAKARQQHAGGLHCLLPARPPGKPPCKNHCQPGLCGHRGGRPAPLHLQGLPLCIYPVPLPDILQNWTFSKQASCCLPCQAHGLHGKYQQLGWQGSCQLAALACTHLQAAHYPSSSCWPADRLNMLDRTEMWGVAPLSGGLPG